jgi:HTH-type transcriptional regulator, transcriptional repressor of NAD biosynthesis genes
MTIALVGGKFLPPHFGHQRLIERARELADEVVVLAFGRTDDPIPVAMRHAWLEEMVPWATVRSVVADDPVDFEDDAAYEAWAAITRRAIGREAIDVLVTSEPGYGPRMATTLGARHELVDPARAAVPISGTAVRRDPFAAWAFLAPCVRAWYVKRVCLVGAESTGKTTLCELLAARYDTVWVPEYGRDYSIPKDARGEPWTTDEFVHIALKQRALEDEAARRANKLLFCDTDALTTALWHEPYLGARAPEVAAIARTHAYDLTFLAGADFPWVQDGFRTSDEARQRMQRRFQEELASRPEPVIELRGSITQRLATAVDAIGARCGIRPPSPAFAAFDR